MASARRSLEAGDVDEALRHLDVALRLKPEYDAAWLLRGYALRRANDSEAAVQSFARVLAISRDSEEGWLGLAASLHDLGRLKDEAAAYDEVLKRNPRSIGAWIDRGAVLHEMKDYRAAIACCDRVLAIRPEHAAAWNNKGAALLRLGEDEAAGRCFDEALHFDPDFFDAMVNRMSLAQKRGRHGEVVLWADRALRIREVAWLWHLKGLAHMGLRESTLAVRALERAIDLDPGQKEVRAALRKAKALREKVDFYRGVYECFGTREPADPGCMECEIQSRCREVSP
jgi:tetratricopeptide (TPR) repeat protein